jgi:L-lactate dehydrogenase complex protein LldG
MTASSSRQMILDSIRAATQNDLNPYETLPRDYIRQGSLDAQARVALMAERLHEYGAEVTESSPADLPAVIRHKLQSSGRRRLLTPATLPLDWRVPGVEWKLDNNLTYDEIEQCDGVVTAASAAIADSGTIVLHHGPEEGRRVISLLPDFHLCILLASQIVETLPEYFARFPQPPRLATYISGPSATADIEMTRIKGVHGPRFLSGILVRDEN